MQEQDLDDLSERELLEFFDQLNRLSMPRLEALLGKAVADHVENKTWQDKDLLIKRKKIQDPLQPVVDFFCAYG